VTFAQILGWLFKRFHDMTVAILMGMLVGSLRKLWPWKETIETILDRHGKEIPIAQRNVLPTVLSSEVVWAIVLAILGFALIWRLHTWAARREAAQAA
jgi:putative membrane protein